MKKMNKKSGFTLVELMVVVIIVGILAAVAVPMMTANTDKAKNSEAVAGLGSINTASRLYMVESGGTAPADVDALVAAGFLDRTDLVGTYITSGDDYDITTIDANGRVTAADVTIDGTTWTFTWNAGTKSYKAVQ